MIAKRFPEHLFLVGCGNMAGPMLARWLECGLDPAHVTVYRPSGKSIADGVAVLDAWPEYLPDGTLVLLGMKPYQIDDVAPHIVGMKGQEIGRAPSELQSLMRISYAVFCLKKKKKLQQASSRNSRQSSIS